MQRSTAVGEPFRSEATAFSSLKIVIDPFAICITCNDSAFSN